MELSSLVIIDRGVIEDFLHVAASVIASDFDLALIKKVLETADSPVTLALP